MNKNNKDLIFLLIGVMGSLITLLGLAQQPAQVFYVIGSSLLLITAIYFKLLYFIALELILISGHGAFMLSIGAILQLALPVLLCVQLLFFYFFSGQLNNIFLLIGIAGIAVISVGFSYENQWIFFTGSLAVAIYALFSSRKNRISLLWAILNLLFASIAIVKIYLETME